MPFDFRLRDLMCPEKETCRPLLNFDNLVKREEVEGYHSKSSKISGCHRMALASRSPMVTFPSSRRYWPSVSRSERAARRQRARARQGRRVPTTCALSWVCVWYLGLCIWYLVLLVWNLVLCICYSGLPVSRLWADVWSF